jgi:hypothetical protein
MGTELRVGAYIDVKVKKDVNLFTKNKIYDGIVKVFFSLEYLLKLS